HNPSPTGPRNGTSMTQRSPRVGSSGVSFPTRAPRSPAAPRLSVAVAPSGRGNRLRIVNNMDTYHQGSFMALVASCS
ncbi:unnamed protein product, partial [Arctogadus glacialis]